MMQTKKKPFNEKEHDERRVPKVREPENFDAVLDETDEEPPKAGSNYERWINDETLLKR